MNGDAEEAAKFSRVRSVAGPADEVCRSRPAHLRAPCTGEQVQRRPVWVVNFVAHPLSVLYCFGWSADACDH